MVQLEHSTPEAAVGKGEELGADDGVLPLRLGRLGSL